MPHRSERRWRDVARSTGLLTEDGGVRPTIFTEMSALAARTGSLNLGQGFPDSDGPAWVRQAAIDAIRAGANQYPPGPRIPLLRRAIADHQQRHYGLQVDPDHEVLVTTGATEALAAAILALCGPGDDVVTLEPFYDSYAAAVALAGASHVAVPLRLTDEGFRLDSAALQAAVTDRTALIVLNSPHNPTGMVLTPTELTVIAEVARRHDVIVITDEVYEHLVFGALAHLPLATLPDMAERTLTISSSGKSYSLTGWKIGWIIGPRALVSAVQTVKQFLTFTTGAPFQPAIAAALANDEFPRWLAGDLARRRDLLVAGLRSLGLPVYVPDGTYFVIADAAPWGAASGLELCRRLPVEAGVAAVPVSAFCLPDHAGPFRDLVRFTFVKDDQTLSAAVQRLAGWAGRGDAPAS